MFKHILTSLLLFGVLMFSACSIDDTIYKNGEKSISHIDKVFLKLDKIEKQKETNKEFKIYLSYNFDDFKYPVILKTEQKQMKEYLKTNSSSDENKIKILIHTITTQITNKDLTKYLDSFNEFQKMLKNTDEYVKDIEILINKVDAQSTDKNSKRTKVLITLKDNMMKYPIKSGYFQTKIDTIKNIKKELDAYLVLAKNANKNKNEDIEALISLKNIADNAKIVYQNYLDLIKSVDKDTKDLNTEYMKIVIDKKIIPNYYVYYIPTYKLDSGYEPSPSTKKISAIDYKRYKTSLTFGDDVQYINGNESVVVGFDIVNSYKLKFQTKENGKVISSKWEDVDETTFNEMIGYMKKFNSNNIVIEFKGKGQFQSELNTIPYPLEYGTAYTYIGNPAYGHWEGDKWSFSDMIMGAMIGNMLFGGNNNNNYYSRSRYDNDRRYYNQRGYGSHFDRYNDRSYQRSTGNYTRTSKIYKSVRKTNISNSLSNKVQTIKSTPKGFTGTNKRVSSSLKSKNGVSYKSFAIAKAKAKNSIQGNSSSSITNVKSDTKKSGFVLPSKRVSSKITTKNGIKYSSNAKRIKPMAKVATKKYDMSKRMKSNTSLQKRIKTQTSKRISHVKNSSKYKAAKAARIKKDRIKKEKIQAARKSAARKARAKASKSSSSRRSSSRSRSRRR
jgi:hypothetical protein